MTVGVHHDQAVTATRRTSHGHTLARRERRVERLFAVATVLLPTIGAGVALALAASGRATRADLALWAAGHVLTGLGIAIGYHRLVSHHAFATTRWITALFVVLGSTGMQGPVVWWAATHRRHHGTSDRPGDPHSPYLRRDEPTSGLRGLWHAHVGWLFVHENTDWPHYVPDLLRDPLVFRLNQFYLVWVALGLAVPAVVGGAISGTWQGAFGGFIWGGLFRVFTTQHATWCINSVTHSFGTRPHESRDQARNNVWLVLPTLGEGWHNNHHAFPNAASNQFEWWQLDPSGLLVRGLSRLGLAWNLRGPGGDRGRERVNPTATGRATE
jgi:stearoyl-CoA desaturase (delta-9 desaturase)